MKVAPCFTSQTQEHKYLPSHLQYNINILLDVVCIFKKAHFPESVLVVFLKAVARK